MAPDHSINFLEFIQHHRRGALLRQADDMLAEIIAAITDTGGNGKLVIELPFKLNEAGQIVCDGKCKPTIPRRSIGTGIYFTTDDGRLSTRDPNQMDIEDEIERRRAREAAE